MKSCESNGGAAYSPPVPALAGSARKAASRNERGGLIGRWVFLHHFAMVLCACLCFAVAARGSVDPAPTAHPETPAAQASPEQGGSSQASPSESKTPERIKTEQYTLLHERQASAVAYSLAGYTLYFVSYFLARLFLFLILRRGWAAKFRDLAATARPTKGIQVLCFVS